MEHMVEEAFTALMLEDMECIQVDGVVVMEDITFKKMGISFRSKRQHSNHTPNNKLQYWSFKRIIFYIVIDYFIDCHCSFYLYFTFSNTTLPVFCSRLFAKCFEVEDTPLCLL
jgi:hypothetical protein